MNAIISALNAHSALSTQALNSPDVKRGLKDIMLNHAALFERLRESSIDGGLNRILHLSALHHGSL